MDAALGAVHAPAPGAAAVIEEFPATQFEPHAGIRFKRKRRHGGGILAEVHDEGLSFVEGHRCSRSELPENDHLAELFVAFLLHPLPDVGLDGFQGQVLAKIDFGAVGGEDRSGEFGIDLGNREFLRGVEALRDPGVVLFAVKDAGVQDGPRNAGLPTKGVGTEIILRPIRISQFQDRTEGAFAADHAFVAGRRDDLVAPPARRQLGRQLVDGPLSCLEHLRHVIGERKFGLGIVRKTGFQDFFADPLSIDIKLKDPEARRHPPRRDHLFRIPGFGQEPGRAVRRPPVLACMDFLLDDRRIRRGNPLGTLPSRSVQGVGTHPRRLFFVPAARGHRRQGSQGSH